MKQAARLRPSPATQENVETQLQVLPDLREREVPPVELSDESGVAQPPR